MNATPLPPTIEWPDGRVFFTSWRSHAPGAGGYAIFIEQLPAIMNMPESSNFIAARLNVANGEESLGDTIGTFFSVDAALKEIQRHLA